MCVLRTHMLGHLSLDIICSSKFSSPWKAVRFSRQISEHIFAPDGGDCSRHKIINCFVICHKLVFCFTCNILVHAEWNESDKKHQCWNSEMIKKMSLYVIFSPQLCVLDVRNLWYFLSPLLYLQHLSPKNLDRVTTHVITKNSTTMETGCYQLSWLTFCDIKGIQPLKPVTSGLNTSSNFFDWIFFSL